MVSTRTWAISFGVIISAIALMASQAGAASSSVTSFCSNNTHHATLRARYVNSSDSPRHISLYDAQTNRTKYLGLAQPGASLWKTMSLRQRTAAPNTAIFHAVDVNGNVHRTAFDYAATADCGQGFDDSVIVGQVLGMSGLNKGGSLDGVTVELRNRYEQVIETTQTDDSGFYVFDLLLPGDYVVRVVRDTLPAGEWTSFMDPDNRGSGFRSKVSLGKGQVSNQSFWFMQ